MKNFFSVCLSLIVLSLSAQDLKHCGADEMRISTLKAKPEVAKAVIKRDEQLEEFTRKFVADRSKAGDTIKYIIPVVFHVIHNYGSENISREQILDGIDVLNKTFQKRLADTANVVAAFKPIHANCQIEFRLATKDPDGNCHSGINRIASQLAYSGDHRVKSLVHWPPNKYLNIYTVINAAGLAGHAVWPSDADTIPEWDGIVLSSSYVGSMGTSDYTRSVALAHECGHYLNLQHIWGGNNVPGFYFLPCADPNKDCNIDDLVADTPPTIGWTSCNLSGKSCGSALDNVQNVMDYSYCNRMFTYGQRDRMQACLNSPIAGRNNLWTPQNLMETGVATLVDNPYLCAADFSADKTVICADSTGNAIKFSDESYNAAPNAYTWSFPGGTPSGSSAANPTVSYYTPGRYDVSLQAQSVGPNTYDEVKKGYIDVLKKTGSPYPLFESFESISNLDSSDWILRTLDPDNRWEITSEAAYSGSKSIKLNHFPVDGTSKDLFYSQAIDLSAAPGPLKLSFKYAYASKDSTSNSTVSVSFAGNCNSAWQKRSTINNLNLVTAPETSTAFVPTKLQWKQVVVNISALYLLSNFHFRIESELSNGNNLYIDDINLSASASLEDLQPLSNVQLYPNPAKDRIHLSMDLNRYGKYELAITDVVGRVISNEVHSYSAGQIEEEISTIGLGAGSYFLRITGPAGQSVYPIIVQH